MRAKHHRPALLLLLSCTLFAMDTHCQPQENPRPKELVFKQKVDHFSRKYDGQTFDVSLLGDITPLHTVAKVPRFRWLLPSRRTSVFYMRRRKRHLWRVQPQRIPVQACEGTRRIHSVCGASLLWKIDPERATHRCSFNRTGIFLQREKERARSTVKNNNQFYRFYLYSLPSNAFTKGEKTKNTLVHFLLASSLFSFRQ